MNFFYQEYFRISKCIKNWQRKAEFFQLLWRKLWLIANIFNRHSYCIFIKHYLDFFPLKSIYRKRSKNTWGDPVLTVIILCVSPSLLSPHMTSWLNSGLTWQECWHTPGLLRLKPNPSSCSGNPTDTDLSCHLVGVKLWLKISAVSWGCDICHLCGTWTHYS